MSSSQSNQVPQFILDFYKSSTNKQLKLLNECKCLKVIYLFTSLDVNLRPFNDVLLKLIYVFRYNIFMILLYLSFFFIIFPLILVFISWNRHFIFFRIFHFLLYLWLSFHYLESILQKFNFHLFSHLKEHLIQEFDLTF